MVKTLVIASILTITAIAPVFAATEAQVPTTEVQAPIQALNKVRICEEGCRLDAVDYGTYCTYVATGDNKLPASAEDERCMGLLNAILDKCLAKCNN